MSRRGTRSPYHGPRVPKPARAADIHVLDRFTAKDLETWQHRSEDLDELHRLLYFATESYRIARREQLLNALNAKPALKFDFEGVRVFPHKYSNDPLSAAGSLKALGGRFSVGNDVDYASIRPFPALYVGENFETAYREYFQLAREDAPAGLQPEDLSLGGSITSVRVIGHIERVLDVTDTLALAPVCRVLGKIKLPDGVSRILRRLKVPQNSVWMIKSPVELQRNLQVRNWRVEPIQFGLPSPSQIFGEMVIAAGYEAIKYTSSKNPQGFCLAIFPSNLQSVNTFVELRDPAPDGCSVRLDMSSADQLCGWDCLPPSRRPTTTR